MMNEDLNYNDNTNLVLNNQQSNRDRVAGLQSVAEYLIHE